MQQTGAGHMRESKTDKKSGQEVQNNVRKRTAVT